MAASRASVPRDSAAAAVVALLAVSNVAANRWLRPAAYVPWNVAVAASTVGLARRAGCSRDELGLGGSRLHASLTVGAGCAGLVAAAYGALLHSPGGGRFFRDQRVTSLPPATARWHLAVRIPLGTVLAEELMFRGVLPALLRSADRPAWMAGATASLLFGAWHALPSIDLARANAGVAQVAGGRSAAAAVPLAVGATAAAGVLLQALRQHTGHVAAPMAAHLAINVLGFVGARLVGSGRLGGQRAADRR